MGAKKTPELIPLCHTIRLDNVSVKCELAEGTKSVRITCEATANEVTGVEMEALTGVSAAALCFYDMCKGIDKGMVIRDIRLIRKTGGKSGMECRRCSKYEGTETLRTVAYRGSHSLLYPCRFRG